MSLVRNYKLWKLGIPQNQEDIVIFEFIEKKLENLETYEVDTHPYIYPYFNKNGELIFSYWRDNKILYAKGVDFMNTFTPSGVNMWNDALDIIVIIVSKTYKLDILFSSREYKPITDEVEKYYRENLK